MKTAFVRALILVGWSIPACAAVGVAILVLLSWFSPEHSYLSIVLPNFVIGVLPWLLLTYIVTSKRFGIGWHWLVSAVASLLAVEISRVALSGVGHTMLLADKLRSACSMPAEEMLSQLQRMAISCGITSWLTTAGAALIHATTAGLLLALVAWAYRRFIPRSSRHE